MRVKNIQSDPNGRYVISFVSQPCLPGEQAGPSFVARQSLHQLGLKGSMMLTVAVEEDPIWARHRLLSKLIKKDYRKPVGPGLP